MQRYIEKHLLDWKEDPKHLPLLLRGARQVGKTFVLEKLGNQHFSSIVNINFELQPEFNDCFDSLKPEEIITSIELLIKQTIVPGKTLLFLDEIQECPNAIRALRYFKEKTPALHVVGAGSLLEFILNDANFRMPVGRVQFIHLKPLSFKEFLLATDNQKLIDYLGNITLENKIPSNIHEHLLKLVKIYWITGGMPAAVQAYLDSNSLMSAQKMQLNLLNTYRHDFGKYATQAQHKYLQQFFNKIPNLISLDFKYSHVDTEVRSRELKVALQQLKEAGLIYPAYSVSGSGLPLASTQNEKKQKLFFLDIGLVSRALQIDAKLLVEKDLLLANQGALAEQFVAQELLAYHDVFEEAQLFFWSRDKKSSLAAVDFVISIAGQIIPIEVKAGTTGRLKSLRAFIDEKHSPLGIRISQFPLSYESKILSIPFYLIGEIARLVK